MVCAGRGPQPVPESLGSPGMKPFTRQPIRRLAGKLGGNKRVQPRLFRHASELDADWTQPVVVRTGFQHARTFFPESVCPSSTFK
jgi:hypothetical protein